MNAAVCHSTENKGENNGKGKPDHDWHTRLHRHSLGWVCAREGTDLVGFVNVAWDGAVHAFLLDTVVAARVRRQGLGTRLVAMAAEGARASGCHWLHVDFEPHLRDFYLTAGDFSPTDAGLIALRPNTA
ncbi:MAG TPA: GNAT family N-acetyltransferase [Actinocrinis sp.]|nr:GNAT family N-acetyltransferase [Actinocrinis sp.]